MDKAAMEAKVSQFKARGEHDPPIKSFIGWKGLVRETVTFTWIMHTKYRNQQAGYTYQNYISEHWIPYVIGEED